MVQLHKEFTDSQVKKLIERYLRKEIGRKYIQEVLGIGKTRFSSLIKAYCQNPDKFSIQYIRNSKTSKISQDIEDSIVKELQNVHCITPLRIKNKGKYTDQITFPVFYKTCQRRIKILSEFNDAKYKYTEDIRDDIDAYLRDSHWHELTRYSVRQETYMGGVVGDILYTGDFKKYLPVIFAGEILCIDKNTSFGLGKFEVR